MSKKITHNETDLVTDTDNGKIKISESVIVATIKTAAEQLPGVLRLTAGGKFADTMAFMIGRTKSKPDSVSVKLTDDRLSVSIRIVAAYGVNLHELGFKLQMLIVHSVKDAIQIEPDRVDVFIDNVESQESDDKYYELLEPIV